MPNWSEQMTDSTANAAAAANAVAPSASVSKKVPVWMTIADMIGLNAYIKRAKVSAAKGDEIRAKWTAAHADGVSVNDPALADQPEAQANAATWEAIAKAKKPRATLETTTPNARLTTRYVDPTLIDVKEGWNARTDMGDLEQLAAQIMTQKHLDGVGVLNDIRVQEKGDGSGRYWLVDGERRYQAVMGLIDGGEFFEFGIPAKIEPADADPKDLIAKMFLANEGKPLLPYEEGLYFKRLQTEFGMTAKEMEKFTGRSDSTIWYGLALVEADEDLVEAITSGKVGTTIAKQIAVNARGDKAKQKELTAKAKAAKGDNKKTAALKKEIDDARRAKAAKERPNLKLKAKKADEAEIAQLGQDVAARLKDLMEKMEMALDADMHEWISNDRELQIAASFGALEALKKVMGVKSAKLVF
jgi:ParB-like chromosome segregation protein Spo0J